MEFFKIRRVIPFMRHALVFNIISLVTFLLAVFFLATKGLHLSVEFTGGIRSYFDVEVNNIYDDDKAQARYQEVNAQYRKDIEAVVEELKKKN